jgi:hypothetical protein
VFPLLDRRRFLASAATGAASASRFGTKLLTGIAATAPVIELTNSRKVTLQSSRAETIHVAGENTGKVRVLHTDSQISADSDVSNGAILRQ